MTVQKENFKIEGMHCASCVSSVEKALQAVPGVETAGVNLATETAHVTYDEGRVTYNQLAEAVDSAGYKAIEQVEADSDSGVETELEKDERKISAARGKMWWAWALTLPIIIWMIPEMFGGIALGGPKAYNVGLFLLGSLVLALPGRETFRSAWKSARHLTPNMDVLIAMGTFASVASGAVNVLHQFGIGPLFANFSGVAGMIMAFHLTGRYIETKAKGRASQAIKKLLTLEAKEATVERDGREEKIPVSSLQLGDIMVVRPGEKMPTDGVVVSGESSVDESLATGESMPIAKSEGSEIIGATINKNGMLKVKATKVGKDTFLSQVIRMVEEAQGSKVPIQALADNITSVFVPVVIGIALATVAAWLAFPVFFGGIAEGLASFLPWVTPGMGPVALALFAGIAVLVIACPCALGLATPTALMVGSGMGAENGVLIRKGAAIQALKDVETIVLDKTGTITEGKPGVTDIVPLTEEFDEERLLQLAGAAEKGSEHPLAQAIVARAEQRGALSLRAEQFEAVTGRGVAAVINGQQVFIGTPVFLEENKIFLDAQSAVEKQRLEDQAKTVMCVAAEGKLIGFIAVADRVKEGSAKALSALRELGFQIAMITGDNERTAQAIAREVGIDRIIANVLPEEKSDEIKRLQAEGQLVAMVGDGINDAPALTQADVGIAIGTGTDVAIESGDIVLVQGELTAVIKAVKLSRATFTKIKQNLFWAFFYNVVMIPLAVLGAMHPVLAEIAMAVSSINVITNSRRLQKQNIQP